jgi:FdhD protein
MSQEEAAVWIALNEVHCATLSCSPHEREALAAGHLLSEGWIDTRGTITAIERATGPGGSIGVRVSATEARIEEMQRLLRHQLAHGCGARHFLDCDPDALPGSLGAGADIDAVHLLRALFAAVDEAVQGGGVHGVALSDGSDLVVTAYDVARHCAVDRALGAGGLAGVNLTASGLVSTARISAAMALKAARCRVGWIASRSIATTLASEIAARFGIVLIERAGGGARVR